jgi:ketosteroid isomerase-like protein
MKHERYAARTMMSSTQGKIGPETSHGDKTMQHETAASDADIGILQELNRAYIASVQASDTRWFEQNLAADFLNSNPDGSLVDRAGFLEQIARPATMSNLEARDVRIRLFGDIAIVHGRTMYTRSDNQPAAGRYTDVWARSGQRWLCVAAHVTRG